LDRDFAPDRYRGTKVSGNRGLSTGKIAPALDSR